MRTFIVRLQEDAISGHPAGSAAPRLCGVVDEVSTGTSATFRNDRELIATVNARIDATRARVRRIIRPVPNARPP